MPTMLIRYTLTFALSAGLVGMSGCMPSVEEDTRTFSDGDNVENTDPHDHAHVHGPHDGHLVELGGEGYHAEVTFDGPTRTLGVYLLAADAKTALPTAAQEISARLELAGKKQEFKLAAVPQMGDPEGQASYFELKDPEALKDVKDIEAVHGEVVATIGETQYRGEIGHDHHDHDHKH